MYFFLVFVQSFCTFFILFHVIFIQEPILNVIDLKEIHSEINFKVPDPILFTNSHDGMDMVSLQSVMW